MELLRCSEEAFARCPSREICGNIQDAMFMEGSDCDRFNRSVADQPMTNGDWIRAMSDEGLAKVLVFYRDNRGDYGTPSGQFFDDADKAIAHTTRWLNEPGREE